MFDEDVNPVILDAGNLFFWEDYTDPGIALAKAKVDAEILVDSYNIIGCDAFSPGSKDFSGGLKFLLNLQKKSRFDFISSNLMKNNKLLFKPYKIINNSNNKIAIIGLSSIFESNEIEFLEPVQALKNVLEDIKKEKVDITILMFNANQKDLNKIYGENFDIDMVIKSGKDRKDKTPSLDGGKFIPTYSAGEQGKIVYKFELLNNDNDLSFVDIKWCENEINNMNSLLEKMKQGDLNADLLKLYKNDAQTLSKIKSRLARIENAENILSSAINTINYEKISLTKTISDKQRILSIINKGIKKKQDLEGSLQGPSCFFKLYSAKISLSVMFIKLSLTSFVLILKISIVQFKLLIV